MKTDAHILNEKSKGRKQQKEKPETISSFEYCDLLITGNAQRCASIFVSVFFTCVFNVNLLKH